jgi:hypothetical protein
MSLNSQNDDFSSVVAEFEETAPSQPRSQPPQSPAQGGTMSPPTTTPTNLGVAVAVAVANTPMDVAGPVLSHIATIALHAEETVAAITHDMDMSTVAYIACRATGNSLQSQLHLSHLNNLFQHVVEFATSTTVMGYLDGVTPDRLERACNNVSKPFPI